MVEFITLFLGGLIAGPAPVQLRVHEDVTALEIRLDEQVVATLQGAPWQLEVDFGERLLPHRLEAIAHDAHGSEVGRASQWINLTPKETDLTITLGRDRSTQKLVARLGWQSLSQDNEPVGADVMFDGKVLKVEDPRVITLPAHDPDRLHHLRVELEFPGALRSAAEVTFGGVYGDHVSSELTAFPVWLEKRGKLPAVEKMQGWFRARGRALRVHAAEKGLAEIVVVRSPEATRQLHALMTRPRRGPAAAFLSEDHRLRFIGAKPALLARAPTPFVVFPRSPEIRYRFGDLLQTLGSVSFPDDDPAETRLSDAVAVAGLFANRSARRRAVVLITTSDSSDASQFSPEQVRPYLESIGVPLVVWNPEEDMQEAGRWGAALDVSTDFRLDEAYRELSRALGRQRIVWLSGSHLPQTIVVDPGIDEVRALRPARSQ